MPAFPVLPTCLQTEVQSSPYNSISGQRMFVSCLWATCSLRTTTQTTLQHNKSIQQICWEDIENIHMSLWAPISMETTTDRAQSHWQSKFSATYYYFSVQSPPLTMHFLHNAQESEWHGHKNLHQRRWPTSTLLKCTIHHLTC